LIAFFNEELLNVHLIVFSERLENLRNIHDYGASLSKIQYFESQLLLKEIVLILVVQKGEQSEGIIGFPELSLPVLSLVLLLTQVNLNALGILHE